MLQQLGGEPVVNPNVTHFTLMCRNHEALRFSWNHITCQAVGPIERLESSYIPLGCFSPDGSIARPDLTFWVKDRGIPETRDGIERLLELLGISSATEFVAAGRGLSLSDQYWLRQDDEGINWDEINYFEHPFSDELGELLISHDPSSALRIKGRTPNTIERYANSPDASLGGNLPKRWTIRDGKRLLIKAGRPTNRYQEPFNEVLASAIAERVMTGRSAYLKYRMEPSAFPDFRSSCPCMCDSHVEFVPAYHILRSQPRRNDESLADFYLRICAEHGIDVRDDVVCMLLVDALTANFDRHWRNFGVLMDAETREWLSAAPLFDTGESFWCDRSMEQGFGPYKLPADVGGRPFRLDLGGQLEIVSDALNWFDPMMLDGFDEVIETTLSANPLISNEAGRIEQVIEAFKRNVRRVAVATSRALES